MQYKATLIIGDCWYVGTMSIGAVFVWELGV